LWLGPSSRAPSPRPADEPPPRVSLSFEPAAPVALAMPRKGNAGRVVLKDYVLPIEGVEATRHAGP
jgi:hypothetical protein